MSASCLRGGFDSSAYLAIIWHSQMKVYFSPPFFSSLAQRVKKIDCQRQPYLRVDYKTKFDKNWHCVVCSSCLLGGFDSSAYLAIIWHSQVKVYFSLPSFLLQPSRSKLTLHSAQLFRRGWCWYLRDDDARWRYIHSGRFCYKSSKNLSSLFAHYIHIQGVSYWNGRN